MICCKNYKFLKTFKHKIQLTRPHIVKSCLASKHKNKITKSISKTCDISSNQINIKAKTTEKLGLIGKEKAIACEAITSVIKYA